MPVYLSVSTGPGAAKSAKPINMMSRLLLLVLCLLSIGLQSAYTQSLDTQLVQRYLDTVRMQRDSARYYEALRYNQIAWDLYEQSEAEDSPLKATVISTLGIAYYQLSQSGKALELLTRALQIRKTFFQEDHLHLGWSYKDLGSVHYERKDFDLSEQYFQQALKIFIQQKGASSAEAGRLYSNLGLVYLAQRKLDKSELMLKKAIAIQRTKQDDVRADLALSYSFLGTVYQLRDQFDRALQYQKMALELQYAVFGLYHPNIGSTLGSISQVYRHLKQLDKSLQYNLKSLAVYRKIYNEVHLDIASCYNEIGKIYEQMDQLDSAVIYFKQALEIDLQTIGEGHPWVIWDYNKIGSIHEALGNQAAAIEYYEKGIFGLDSLRMSMPTTSTKKHHINKRYNVFEHAIQASLLLGQHEDDDERLKRCFFYSEKSKSNILLETLNQFDSLTFQGVPKEMLAREHDLKRQLAKVEKQRFSELQKGIEKDPSLLSTFDSVLFVLRHEYSDLLLTLQRKYPSYHQLKYQVEVLGVEELQRDLLAPEQALLEYFVGDDHLYLFLVKPDDYQVISIPLDFSLDTWVAQMRKGLYEYHLSAHHAKNAYRVSMDTFAHYAHRLYQKLIGPVAELLPEQLIIVPDGILGYIPFDVLLTSPPDDNYTFKSHDYLLRKHQISYSYSATLLEEMRQPSRRKPTYNVLAIAPFFGDHNPSYADLMTRRNALEPLTFNVPEASQVSALLKGKLLSGTDASKEQFLKFSPNFRYLHLATHGKANDEHSDYSYLAFTPLGDSLSDYRLYVKELYNLRLNADMVVLSACETGIGELQRGEGIISLARGFSYAGAKSIITSLWSVNDAASQELMINFYTYLKNGLTKDAALRQARLDYLDVHTHDEAHPYYWAAFIPIGNMAEIETGSDWKWIVIALILAILTAIFFWKRSQSRVVGA